MSDFKVNSIANKNGAYGPSIAGVATVNSTGCMKIPSGDTSKRVTLPRSAENIVTDQLFALYDAGQGSVKEISTTLFDVSGNGRDLPMAEINDPNSYTNKAVTFDHNNGGGIRFTYPGAQWWRDKWGTKYNFTVGNPAGSPTHGPATYNQFSVEMWYKIPSSTDRIHLWEFGNGNEGAGTYSNIQMNLNDGRAIWVYTDNGSPYHLFSSSDDGEYTDGTIRHLVYTYNYSELRDNDLTLGNGLGYMNGSAITDVTFTGTQRWNINQIDDDGNFPWFAIGGAYQGSHHWPNGSILYKCAVYTKALSASEVSQNYNALLYRFS